MLLIANIWEEEVRHIQTQVFKPSAIKQNILIPHKRSQGLDIIFISHKLDLHPKSPKMLTTHFDCSCQTVVLFSSSLLLSLTFFILDWEHDRQKGKLNMKKKEESVLAAAFADLVPLRDEREDRESLSLLRGKSFHEMMRFSHICSSCISLQHLFTSKSYPLNFTKTNITSRTRNVTLSDHHNWNPPVSVTIRRIV